ncbi:hypothetical protein FISHEDRAFT_35274 [Fistulina hepatica ATCC 64428]|uniref:Uncharacterized protein n=1 Tax=Fistulina hepatica ATCC 64428 TaxID=1128425 RepID=A0A0D7AKV2_9AGAR|nr:hypothetical protein FISHEDRAFT_35274 [Fistulina hepatica ATCC 64428]
MQSGAPLFILKQSLADPLPSNDHALLRHFALRVDKHMPLDTFQRLSLAFPESNIKSWYLTQKRAAELSCFNPEKFDCCINCCMCFVGPHADLARCLHCHEARLNARGRPRKQFQYLPLIPRLVGYYKNAEIVNTMSYRAEFDCKRHAQTPEECAKGLVEDVMDGSHYRHLQSSHVVVNGQEHAHRFFDSPRDIALGLSSDGFCPFRR